MKARKLYDDGNYKEALGVYRRLALSPRTSELEVGGAGGSRTLLSSESG